MDQAHPFYQKLQNSNNILLVKDDVGKPKKCVRNLPNGDFSYGSKPKKDSEGAGAILSSWQIHKPTSDEEAEKDFKRLNKMSLNNKLITPKQVSEFVKQTDVRVKDKRNTQDGRHCFTKSFSNIAWGILVFLFYTYFVAK